MAKSKKNVLIISYHFYPSLLIGARRISELAQFLVQNGYAVKVVCQALSEVPFRDATLLDRVKEVFLIRVSSGLGGERRNTECVRTRNGPIKKKCRDLLTRSNFTKELLRQYDALAAVLGEYRLWALRAIAKIGPEIIGRFPPALVISSGPPHSHHFVALLIKLLWRSKWIMDLRDPWVGSTCKPACARSNIGEMIEEMAERLCVKNADAITCASPGAKRDIVSRHMVAARKARVVLNGYDQVVPNSTCTGRLSIIHAGTIYYNRDPRPVLNAYYDFLHEPQIDGSLVSFHFVGYCEQWKDIDIKDWIDSRGLRENVHLHPMVCLGELKELYSQSNLLLCLAQGQPFQIPAKMFEYIGLNKEILVITEVDSDSAWLARETGYIRVRNPADNEGIKKEFRDLYRFHAVERGTFQARKNGGLDGLSRLSQNRLLLDLIKRTQDPELCPGHFLGGQAN